MFQLSTGSHLSAHQQMSGSKNYGIFTKWNSMQQRERRSLYPLQQHGTGEHTGFYSQKLWGLTFLALEPWAEWSGLGLGSLPPDFYLRFLSTTRGCGTAHVASPSISASLPLLHVWMNVTSLIPWLSDFHTARFSDDSV